jgi:rhodanese-related sulfurtransferase
MAAFVGLNDVSGFSSLITATELKRELASAEPPFVIDVRDLQEYEEEGHLEGVTHIPLFEVRGRMGVFRGIRAIVVHCRVGKRGHGELDSAGGGVRNLTGGGRARCWRVGFGRLRRVLFATGA